MGQFLKLWWMIAWRLAIFAMYWAILVTDGSPSSAMAGAIGFSLVPALVMLLAVRKSIYTFPIIRLLMRKPVIIELDPGRQHSTQQNPLLEPEVE